MPRFEDSAFQYEEPVYKWRRISPVRFTRSKSEPPAGSSWMYPDMDDRGFTSPYNGPVVGVVRGDINVITVARDLLDPGAPLWVSSEDPTRLTIEDPATPGKLPDGPVVDIRFAAGNLDGNVKIRVHAQAPGGPIIAELTVLVSVLMSVRCAIHRTAIFTPPSKRSASNTTKRTFKDIDVLMNEVNRQWRPNGIRFLVYKRLDHSNLTTQTAVGGFAPPDGTLLCPVYGKKTSNLNFGQLMKVDPVPGVLNVYFVHHIGTASPDGRPSYIGFGSSSYNGLVVADTTDSIVMQAHTVSHELGHIMTLAGSVGHSDDDPYNTEVRLRRHDLWSRRRMMYYMVGLEAADRNGDASPATLDVPPKPARPVGRYKKAMNQDYTFAGIDCGHGAGKVGHLFTIKHLANDRTDNEYTDARVKAASMCV